MEKRDYSRLLQRLTALGETPTKTPLAVRAEAHLAVLDTALGAV